MLKDVGIANRRGTRDTSPLARTRGVREVSTTRFHFSTSAEVRYNSISPTRCQASPPKPRYCLYSPASRPPHIRCNRAVQLSNARL